MQHNSWGLYPQIKSHSFRFDHSSKLKHYLTSNSTPTIAFGNGRSYGDSALASHIIYCKPYNYMLDFDKERGILHCQSGVMLNEIIETFLPQGWFLKVTPGTKLITVGGALASDVHGKNHHVEGCFSESVVEFDLMLPSGEVVTCSQEQNRELFLATSGGMGLTGVILTMKLQLKKVGSQFVDQTTIKTKNLEETISAFEEYAHKPYSVAWIDCLAQGNEMGKSILTVGDFADDGDFDYRQKKRLNVPFMFPSFALNTLSVKAFNWLYYLKAPKGVTHQKVSIDSFFYPLDSIRNWNRIYGKGGFTQYQFIIPKEGSKEALTKILQRIAKSGKGSFLAVLKLYGKENENYLSFPIEGYSLALDFKIEKGLFELLDELDKIVVEYSGRVYLTKDVRMSQHTLEEGYPKLKLFKAVRKQYKMDETFQSLQSQRLGL
jgi:decaprenylphospho-beta-D-ribofuranose 2-oxidase